MRYRTLLRIRLQQIPAPGVTTSSHLDPPREIALLKCHQSVSPENEKPADIAGPSSKLCLFENFWSGRRGSNPRPRPWQGRALPLSYTRIREIGGDHSPVTGRAMPNAARECNRPRCAREQARSTGHNSAIGPQISPKAAGLGSADCKLGRQAPIRAGTC